MSCLAGNQLPVMFQVKCYIYTAINKNNDITIIAFIVFLVV